MERNPNVATGTLESSCTTARTVFSLEAYAPCLEGSDLKRHLRALVLLTLDHWSHNSRRDTDDLGHVLGETKLEVLEEVGDEGLHLDDTADSDELRAAGYQDLKLTRNAS